MPPRLRAGKKLIKIYCKNEGWPLADQTAAIVTSLVPLLTPRFLEHQDKQHLLSEIAGLASDIAAVALMVEKSPYDAIERLETGRGVIMGSLNEAWVDISDLRQRYPHLADEYIGLRNQLQMPGVMMAHVNQHQHMIKQLERVIKKVQVLPGFDRFLLSPSESELRAAAAFGPIVIVNVSDYRCDAFILEENQLSTLRLDHLHHKDVQKHAENLAEPKQISTETLEWLWDTIANPILQILGFTRIPEGRWPRIWWVSTGSLARFPLHAAGYHSNGSFNTVLDRVISSYSASAKALVLGRRNRSTIDAAQRPGRYVLVGMEHTPSEKRLPFVSQEIDMLELICKDMQLQVMKPVPSKTPVLSALGECDVFHFAGHGFTDKSDPSNSCLLLSDGPLTIANLLETSLHSRMPFLAYLSACGTGQVKHDDLIDEALHLIAACQIAGFLHVIGTLWEVNDQSCVTMATEVYEWMKSQGSSDESASGGLHRASRKLRDLWVSENNERTARCIAAAQDHDDLVAKNTATVSQDTARDIVSDEEIPLFWVPYVHFGV